MSEQKIPARSELDPQYTWATTDLYPSDEAWEADIPKACGPARAPWARAPRGC